MTCCSETATTLAKSLVHARCRFSLARPAASAMQALTTSQALRHPASTATLLGLMRQRPNAKRCGRSTWPALEPQLLMQPRVSARKSIRSHRQQTNLFSKVESRLLHCAHSRHLHRLLSCFLHLFSLSSSLLLSFTASAFTKARFRWLHPGRHCAAFVMSPWQFVTLLQTSNWVMFMQSRGLGA